MILHAVLIAFESLIWISIVGVLWNDISPDASAWAHLFFFSCMFALPSGFSAWWFEEHSVAIKKKWKTK